MRGTFHTGAPDAAGHPGRLLARSGSDSMKVSHRPIANGAAEVDHEDVEDVTEADDRAEANTSEAEFEVMWREAMPVD